MATEYKYEKIDAQHIRLRIKLDPIIKVDLNQEKADLNSIMNDGTSKKIAIISKLNGLNLENYDSTFQTRQEEVDALLDLFNNDVTEETIQFINP
jgi:hypothetical protein